MIISNVQNQKPKNYPMKFSMWYNLIRYSLPHFINLAIIVMGELKPKTEKKKNTEFYSNQ